MSDSMTSLNSALDTHIDTLEQAYELFLSYAAKGTDGANDSGTGTDIRMMVTRALQALDELENSARVVAEDDAALLAWIDVLAVDIGKSRAGIALVDSCATISSQLVDNLNASIHIRALLTDLFVLDEALSAKRKSA